MPYRVTTMNQEKLKTLIKLTDSLEYHHSKYQALADFFEIGAIVISKQADLTNYPPREKRYHEIIKQYNKQELDILVKLFAETWRILTNMTEEGFGDYLGELYMQSGTKSELAGQFFTPYHIAHCMAQMAFSGDNPKLKDIVTLCEPTCGSGVMVLATADALWNQYNVNYARHLFVVATDIDPRCVHMCYIQLSLAGIPAIIEQRDALTQQLIGETWKTPALMYQWSRFRDYIEGYQKSLERRTIV